jgi:ferredoxin
VHRKLAIRSVECTACQSCVDACPQPATLSFGRRRQRLPAWGVGAAVAAVFLLAIAAARLTGHWQSAVSAGEYAARIQWIDQVDHSRGRVAAGPAATAAVHGP